MTGEVKKIASTNVLRKLPICLVQIGNRYNRYNRSAESAVLDVGDREPATRRCCW